ncbi:uracil-DNA glycosylase [Streptococcus porcinus]|uniref:Uracil-DNA glycosylase n=1 Tax=Streptococcus porcinus str. Jelinkova 176 TaxID=873448 RepID=A0ABN0CTR7_STRPO|nr:uracil-DNA glycosylase [Streptococcus porcinus]EGJ26530.1 uracil-DNA glycosylase [Streptococcus porcinus str. Jelinkova 176]SQG43904.1 uracil-DNA glycosylase [Streptococcus porcinus]VTT44759.1 uracil-DNA glycosylase [Streptococcus porcinus]
MKHSTWHKMIKASLPDDYFAKINHFLDQAYQSGTIYPKRENVFRSLVETPYEETKVVILGQDPYHGPRQAQGLSFSVPDDLPAPPSLQNMLKELETDIGLRDHHDLLPWAKQGVLLLNACLTVPEHQANGHAGLIWEPFTDAVIKVANSKETPVVFILWGGYARKKKTLITNPKHLVIESAHPSPLSAYRGFFGSQPYSRANHFLEANGLAPIDWLS